MNNNDYVKNSIELHLFFDRIMKEHAFFLETAFTDKDNNLKKIAIKFQNAFGDILNNVIMLADGNVSKEFISSGEMVTKDTLDAEIKTVNLTGTKFNNDITRRELDLRSGQGNFDQDYLNALSNINKKTLPVVENLIQFKNDILNNVLSCKMYTTNYPLLITHIINEAKMYYKLLSMIENRSVLTKNDIYEQEFFWNTIMKEHAEFIRGLLDPTEKELIMTTHKYVSEYEELIDKYKQNSLYLTNISLNETIDFRNFKVVGEEGILNCKIKSVIIPLLADHVVREANHFIRVLENIKS